MAITTFHNYESGDVISSDDLNAVRGAVNVLEGNVFLSAQNNSGATIYPGMAVAMHSSGVGFVLADKGAISTRAIGLAKTEAANGFALVVQTAGVLDLADWSAAAGSSALSALARLYLGDDGLLTVTPTAASGEILQAIGQPNGPQKLAIQIAEPIRRE